MELIDKQKLLEWLDKQYKAHKPRNGYDEYHQGMQTMIDYTEQAVDLGTFDDHSTKEEIAKLRDALAGATIIANHSGAEIKQLREEIAAYQANDNLHFLLRRKAHDCNQRRPEPTPTSANGHG